MLGPLHFQGAYACVLRRHCHAPSVPEKPREDGRGPPCICVRCYQHEASYSLTELPATPVARIHDEDESIGGFAQTPPKQEPWMGSIPTQMQMVQNWQSSAAILHTNLSPLAPKWFQRCKRKGAHAHSLERSVLTGSPIPSHQREFSDSHTLAQKEIGESLATRSQVFLCFPKITIKGRRIGGWVLVDMDVGARGGRNDGSEHPAVECSWSPEKEQWPSGSDWEDPRGVPRT